MHLVSKENEKEESEIESRFRLFRVKKSFICFERKAGQKLPVRMRVFNDRGNQELNTKNSNKIAIQLRAIGELYEDIENEEEPEESLIFIDDYDDPHKTSTLIEAYHD